MNTLLDINVTSLMTFSTSLFFQGRADIYQGFALVLHVHLNTLLILSAQKLLLTSQQQLFTYTELTFVLLLLTPNFKLKKDNPFTCFLRVQMIAREGNSIVKNLTHPYKC